MIMRILTITVILIHSSWLQAVEFDLCNDTVIDAVTEEAFGPHGIPYSGEIICYRDKEKTVLKSKRAFDKGNPIGQHICYSRTGEKGAYMDYNYTDIRTKGFYTTLKPKINKSFYPAIKCNSEVPETCWTEGRKCKKGDKWCLFQCN